MGTLQSGEKRAAQVASRIWFLVFVVLFAFGVLTGKLWYEQVVRGPLWAAKIQEASEVTVRVPSVRGEIRDRNGLTLVANRTSYGVDFYLSDMVRGFKKQNGWLPLTTFKAPVYQMLTEKSEADIIQIVNSSVLPRLQELDLAEDYSAERLQKHYRTDTEVPFAYREEIDFSTLARIAEHDLGLPGVEIGLRPVRHYVYGALAAHVLGYVGAPVNIDKLPDVHDFTYYQPDVEGKSQVEQSMEAYLRGTPGMRVLERNAKGSVVGELYNEPPEPGNNVYLTLDARLQFIAEEALRHPALGRAAAVVLDPNNGDILAMVSVPSFDPNIFIPSVSSADWKTLLQDEAVPLINRALSGFPPGSTFKIVTALAGVKKGLAATRFNCPGGIQYGNHYFKCWIADKHGQHGTLSLPDAMKVSCNSFFYQYGNAAGIDTIDRIGSLLGLGQAYEIGLSDEKEGCLPGPDWMRLRSSQEKWTSAHTANVSIGQGYVLASPLQMAVAYAAVANGGVVYQPRLVKSVFTPEGSPLLNSQGLPAVPDEPRIRADLREEMSAAQIELVRRGFWKVVNEDGGTGGRARLNGVTVAGKTGTAQDTDRGKEDNVAWFCCFAPYEKPRYVVVTMVQGGKHGGSVAGPVAARILERCLALDQGRYQVALKPLAPAHNPHPFNPIEALDYANTARIALANEESAPEKPAADSKPQLSRSRAHPDIRAEADSRGKLPPRKAPPAAVQATADKRNFFARFFGPKKTGPAPAPPAPLRRGAH